MLAKEKKGRTESSSPSLLFFFLHRSHPPSTFQETYQHSPPPLPPGTQPATTHYQSHPRYFNDFTVTDMESLPGNFPGAPSAVSISTAEHHRWIYMFPAQRTFGFAITDGQDKIRVVSIPIVSYTVRQTNTITKNDCGPRTKSSTTTIGYSC